MAFSLSLLLLLSSSSLLSSLPLLLLLLLLLRSPLLAPSPFIDTFSSTAGDGDGERDREEEEEEEEGERVRLPAGAPPAFSIDSNIFARRIFSLFASKSSLLTAAPAWVCGGYSSRDKTNHNSVCADKAHLCRCQLRLHERLLPILQRIQRKFCEIKAAKARDHRRTT